MVAVRGNELPSDSYLPFSRLYILRISASGQTETIALMLFMSKLDYLVVSAIANSPMIPQIIGSYYDLVRITALNDEGLYHSFKFLESWETVAGFLQL